MRASLHIGIATALILGVLSASAGADMTVYYRTHTWDAFSGSDEIGKQVCGSVRPIRPTSTVSRFASR
jgi:hypothetical protein